MAEKAHEAADEELAEARIAIGRHPTKFQPPCRTCGNERDWSISYFEDDTSVVALSILDRSDWETKEHGAIIAAVCGRCGFLNLYDRKKFFAFVKSWRPNT
ncbi:hypothetical protein [Roseomonas chloroacetimidivorans]|uniref:hypothetical protein n=1 Tax=Roseomonas chloroacetimidivorans TaxID=1766656 RepID=UPI003C71A460